ncbi:MAG: transposase, partial [Candidatus Melainabacteria bacterium HGW-Melainabacteria-1]
MGMVNRRITYRLYPNQEQQVKLLEMRRLHQQLYNAALEERIQAYRKCSRSLSFAQQCKSLTQLRAELPEYEALNAQSSQVTLKRVDDAYAGFFRRIKDPTCKNAGFPRFKSIRR